MLEASGFDFRNRHPQKLLLKLAKSYGFGRDSEVTKVAYCVSLDLYRCFAPLKQTSATMAFSCLELARRLLNDKPETQFTKDDYNQWKTSRVEIMGMC